MMIQAVAAFGRNLCDVARTFCLARTLSATVCLQPVCEAQEVVDRFSWAL
jgi:hypothetical protein